MLPLSLGRVPGSRLKGAPPLAWLRPANIAAKTSDDTRALITWLAVFVTVGVLIALGHVWLRLQVTALGYQLSATRQVIERLEQEQHDLAVETATLDAPARLEALAQRRLGMARPQKGQEAVLP